MTITGEIESFEVEPDGSVLLTVTVPSEGTRGVIRVGRQELAGIAEASTVAWTHAAWVAEQAAASLDHAGADRRTYEKPACGNTTAHGQHTFRPIGGLTLNCAGAWLSLPGPGTGIDVPLHPPIDPVLQHRLPVRMLSDSAVPAAVQDTAGMIAVLDGNSPVSSDPSIVSVTMHPYDRTQVVFTAHKAGRVTITHPAMSPQEVVVVDEIEPGLED